MLLPIWQSTTDTGKNCRSSIFQLYRWALAQGWCSGDNPADSKGVLAVYLEPLKTARKKPQNYAAADFNEIPQLIKALLSKKRPAICSQPLASSQFYEQKWLGLPDGLM